MAMATKRLQKELAALIKESPELIRARPMEKNILNFHYVLEGPPGSPYAGGFYHGVLKFTSGYPHAPPAILMYTPSGRFMPSTRICTTMSDFHPETWNPMWSVRLILVGLQSFMMEAADKSLGSVEATDEEKRRLAAESLGFNVKDKIFCSLFPELVELHERRKSGGAASGAAAAGSSGSSAAPAAAVPLPSAVVADPAAAAVSEAELMSFGVGKLKELLAAGGADVSGCIEKSDLQALARVKLLSRGVPGAGIPGPPAPVAVAGSPASSVAGAGASKA